MTEEQRGLLITPDTNFMKIGDEVYSLEKISDSGLEIENKLIAYHKTLFKDAVEAMQKATIKEDVEEWNKQIENINRKTNNLDIRIPTSSFNKLLMVHQGRLCSARVILYGVHSIKGHKDYTYKIIESLKKLGLYEKVKNMGTYLIKFKQPFKVPMVVLKDLNSHSVYTPDVLTYHTFSADKRICTGNYKDFMSCSDAELEERFGRVNISSLANSIMQYKDVRITLDELLLSIDKKTIEVINEGESTWKI